MPVSNPGQTGWVAALFLATLTSASPLVLAAIAGVLSERSGVVNIALEGMILTGAFVGVCAGQTSTVTGLACAVTAGGLLGLLLAYLTQNMRMNHVVAGLAINLLAAGFTRYLALRLFPSEGVHVPGAPQRLYVSAAIVAPILAIVVLQRTRFGLRLRAAGESAEGMRMAGLSPVPIRYAAVGVCGMLAAFAGTELSLAEAHTFSSNMSAGKGYIALAAVIFGKWNPAGAAAGAMLFGFFYAVQTQLQISGVHLKALGIEWNSPFLLDCVPYVTTILALLTLGGRTAPPGDLGVGEP